MAVAGKAERAESGDDSFPAELAASDASDARAASNAADSPIVAPGYLPADYVVMAFAIFNLVCIAIGFPHARHGGWLLAGILPYLTLVISLRWLPSAHSQPLTFLRDAHALLAIAPAYAIAGMINQSIFHRYFDDLVLGWDRAIFGGHPHQYLARMWPWGPLSEALHMSYWLYLGLVPVLGFTLYFMRRHAAFRIVATSTSATFFLCQFAFVLFPVRGPYYTFPPVEAAGSVFPALVHATLDHGASVGTAFPSSHCAAAVVVAMLSWRYAPRGLAVGITLITLGILVGTVYGGFHYAVDAMAGLLIGLTMGVLGPRLHARLARRSSVRQGA